MPASTSHLSSHIIDGTRSTKNFEPYRVYNYDLHILDLPNNGEEILSLSVETGMLPNPSFDEIELGHGNDFIYLIGKARVEPITFVFRDFIDPNTAGALQAWYGQHYDPDSGAQGFASDYKKDGFVSQHDPQGGNLRRWQLAGIFIQNANFGGTLDNNTSDIVRVEISFRFDRAVPIAQATSGSSPLPGLPALA